MNTEHRLRFEAKHKVPENIYYDEARNEYVYRYSDEHKFDQVNAGTASEYRQNTLWQGYQSALEDRQGEAVAWNGHVPLHLQQRINALRLELPQFIVDDLENAIRTAMAAVFVSPQPAQPDQWNAAIEAAASICQAEGDEWDSDDVQTLKNYAHACRDRILALRKGA